MDNADTLSNAAWKVADAVDNATCAAKAGLPPWLKYTLIAMGGLYLTAVLIFVSLCAFAPKPRAPRTSEKQYITIASNGGISTPQPLPSWFESYTALREMAKTGNIPASEAYQAPGAELFMTLVVPAYNEEARMAGMLEEAVAYLDAQYGHHGTPSKSSSNGALQASGKQADPRRGWEILVVSDGSTDKTVETALRFARAHTAGVKGAAVAEGPWGVTAPSIKIASGALRVIQLEENRGKGGAVTHGMRHARGSYVVFADADGASRFSDLGSLVTGCEKAKDKLGRAVGVGSRAHMVGTEAVVKRSLLRNTLMRAFHLLIRALTTPKTARIRDTQCGFKLFTRAALPYIVPFMHTEGWIFDVEMLMLGESANIPMVEVPIGWKEVKGSKLNVIKDSVGMAIGLAMLRVCWGAGVFSRD